LARWRNHFSQLLNVCGVNDARQTEIHAAEPLVPEPSAFEVEKPIEKLKETAKVWGFRCKVEENCTLLSYYETSSGYFVPIYEMGDKTDYRN
jgi:hypothetical protein